MNGMVVTTGQLKSCEVSVRHGPGRYVERFTDFEVLKVAAWPKRVRLGIEFNWGRFAHEVFLVRSVIFQMRGLGYDRILNSKVSGPLEAYA